MVHDRGNAEKHHPCSLAALRDKGQPAVRRTDLCGGRRMASDIGTVRQLTIIGWAGTDSISSRNAL